MDFNPLDLLASAAELQTKTDDGEQEPNMVTCQKPNAAVTNTKTFTAVLQKENKEIRTVNNNKNISNNNVNTNTIKGKSVIIRKIKVGANSDLEKMLNEHNYGNAKKNSDSNIRVVFEGNKTDNAGERLCETSPKTKGIHTIGKNGDKITIITVSNKDSGSPSSDVKCNNKDLNTSNTDTTTCNSSLTHHSLDSSTVSEESSHCSVNIGHVDSDSPEAASWEDGHVSSQNGQTECGLDDNDNTTGQVEGRAISGQSVMTDNIIDRSDSDSLNRKGTIINNTSQNSEDNYNTLEPSECVENKLDLMGCEKETCSNSLEITSCKEERNVISIDSVNRNPSNVFVRDKTFNELDHKVSTSDFRKTPYINVSVKQSTKTILQETQPMVININSKEEKSYEKTLPSKNFDDLEQILIKTDSGINQSSFPSEVPCGSDVCFDKNKPNFMDMVTSKSIKLDISKCDKLDISQHRESCDSLKSLELNENLCGDSVSGSVHLLSPDRRNPDSVGIAESPITNPPLDVQEISDTEQHTDSFRFFSEYMSGTGDNEQSGEQTVTDPGCEEGKDSPAVKDIQSIQACGSDQSIQRLSIDSCLSPSLESGKSDNKSANEQPIFRFDFDHSYAGLPGKINSSEMLREQDMVKESDVLCASDETEAGTPVGSLSGDLSQDSGYEDITQSPASESVPLNNSLDLNVTTDTSVNTQNLVPVLVSINDNGKLMLHNDAVLQNSVTGKLFTLPNNGVSNTADTGVKLITGTNLTPLTTQPILLSPVGKAPALPQTADSVLGLLRPTTADTNSSFKQISPPKFGKFRIGTFGSFSNTGMKVDDPPQLYFNKSSSQEKSSRSSGKRNSAGAGVSSGKSSPVVDTLGTLVQKVRSSLSPSSQIDTKTWNIDHIHHDHDYCMKNLMPSVVSSVLEAKLQKELTKNKQSAAKTRKVESDSVKSEGKLGKRKRTSSNTAKEDLLFEGLIYDEDSNSQSDFLRPKSRAERYIEQKSTEPKVKITGSSNFQDQFVYFMNTKKRSRRRESRDSPIPLPIGSDKLFIPPKPGDIIVPHLTDQDIENLKQRSKQKNGQSGINSLRSEFMASKLANVPFSRDGQGQPESADDERSIINTILSLENENLTENETLPDTPTDQTDQAYNESMEMYGQGLGSDIMNLIPEQMNLTQEQMDLLFSAVDEVQNSSPGLIGAEKLVSTDTGDSTFGQFPAVQNIQPGTGHESNESTGEKQAEQTELGQQTETDNVCNGENQGKSPTLASGVAGIEKQPSTSNEENGGLAEEVTTSSETVDKTSDAVIHKQADDTSASAVVEITSASKSVTEETHSDIVEQTDSKDNVGDVNTAENVSDTVGAPLQTSCEASSVSTTLPSKPHDLPESISTSVPTDQSNCSISSIGHQSTSSINSVVNQSSNSVNGIVDHPDNSVNMVDQSTSSVSNMVLPANIPVTTNSLSNGDITLQTIDRGPPIDLLGNDFRLDKADLFIDNSGPVTSGSPFTSSGVTSSLQQQVPADYSAPWIVTVSMYWNDLPAVMMQNQPFVRLVDIHKQILPAKDTGILKKRCQLMGIRVENCSEMQRYFLVQYGKAYNSKSTLIVSKESANELIGYYVDPQPKSTRVEENTGKSVIEHRREQLRRIALARRAELRARQAAEKREDPRAIKDPPTSTEVDSVSQPHDPTKVEVEIPKVLSVTRQGGTQTPGPGLINQRSTRHKKINFLEMLRGDSVPNTTEEDGRTEELTQGKKQLIKQRSADTNEKKVKKSQEKKIKIVKYSVQPKVPVQPVDSSETETDYSSNEETDSTSGSEMYVVKESTYRPRPVVQKDIRFNPRSKLKVGAIRKLPAPKLPLRVKISAKKPQKSTGTITPVTMNRSVGTLAAPYSQSRRDRSSHSTRVVTPSSTSWNGSSSSDENKALDPILKYDKSVSDYEKVKVVPNYSGDLNVTSFGEFGSPGLMKEFTEADLKVSQSLPSEILDTSGIQEEETVSESNVTEKGDASKIEDINTEENENKATTSDEVTVVESETEVNKESENKTCVTHESANTESVTMTTPIRSQSPPHVTIQRHAVLTESVLQREAGLQIIHRSSSLNSDTPTRAQLGELFIEKYSNKKSLCIRCYTCRKMMSVDLFLRHLHDISGGFIPVEGSRIIDLDESDVDEQGLKIWESFQRKKELFDNNQVPSPDMFAESMLCSVNLESKNLCPENAPSEDIKPKPAGPLIITTPVSPVKSFQHLRQASTSSSIKRSFQQSINDGEGTRSSSRKRKKKQLYPCEEYSFSKFPRLQGGTEKTNNV